jgi:hydrogenase maturation protease
MSTRRLLIAGIGNVLRGDDGFGVEVVRRLLLLPWPEGALVRDFGIRGVDLAYALSDGYEAAILVDAMPRGKPPGTVTVLEPSRHAVAVGAVTPLDPHGTDPVSALLFADSLGGAPLTVRVVGCEPHVLGDDDEPQMGLSVAVTAAVEPAVLTVLALARELLGSVAGEQSEAPQASAS